MAGRRPANWHQRSALIVAVALFSWWYATHSRVGINSVVSAHANLAVEPPFVFRLLMPRLLSWALPHDWLDLEWTRGILAWMFSLASIWAMPLYLARLTGRQLAAREIRMSQMAMLGLLVAHYALPRSLKFYYVYDLPAVWFGMLLFLGLTDHRYPLRALAVALAPLCALNRETAIVAVVHAAAWHWTQTTAAMWRQPRTWPLPWPWLAAAGVAILATRPATAHLLALPTASSFSWTDEGQFRLLANLQRIATKHHHALALLWFGAGAIWWMPKHWRHFNPTIKGMCLASLPPFVLFSLVGNLVELRMFSEFVPLLAAGLALVLSQRAQAQDAARHPV